MARPHRIRISVGMWSCDRTVSGYPRDRHLNACPEAPRGQREKQRLQEHSDGHAVDVIQVPVHADDPGQRRAEELPVPQYRDPPGRSVMARDAHRPVHHGTEIAPHVREAGRQRRTT